MILSSNYCLEIKSILSTLRQNCCGMIRPLKSIYGQNSVHCKTKMKFTQRFSSTNQSKCFSSWKVNFSSNSALQRLIEENKIKQLQTVLTFLTSAKHLTQYISRSSWNSYLCMEYQLKYQRQLIFFRRILSQKC